MRLTLRNLLRFLDQTRMRAVERTRLEQLVDESEKADAWIQRIDSLRRSPHTLAPSIHSTEVPIAKVVAYLDSTMGEEATIEFERSLLSSDPLLAEIACCHEIRETIRNESAPPIPISLRQSVYNLATESPVPESDDASSIAEETDSVTQLVGNMEDLPFVDGRPDDPPHLDRMTVETDEQDDEPVSLDAMSREAKRKTRLVVAVLVFVVAGMMAFTYWIGRQSERSSRTLPANPNLADTGNDSLGQDADSEQDADLGSDPDSDQNSDQAANSGDAPESGAEEQSADTPDSEPAFEHFPKRPDEDASVAPESDLANALPERPLLDVGPVVTAPPVPAPALDIASFANNRTTTLQRDSATDTWIRAKADSPLSEETEWMVLAGTTTNLDFGGNLAVQIDGPARFAIGSRDIASGADTLRMHYGRLHVTATVADMDLLIEHQGRRYRLTLPVQGAKASASFRKFLARGEDPRSVVPASFEWFVTESERVSLTEGDQTWMLPLATAMIRGDSDRAEYQIAPVTGQVSLPYSRPRDYATRLEENVRKNLEDLPEVITADAPVFDILAELKSDIRQERRFAALSWLAAIGNYDYLLDFLNDEKNRNNWRSVIEAVRDSVVAHPEYTETLYQALSQTGEEQRDIMFKLIIGYSKEELEGGQARKLVELLDHDSLAVRVLAIEQIRHITGGLAYGYTPHSDRKARRRIIDRQWERVLKRKELQYQTEPELPVPKLSAPTLEDPAVPEDGEAGGN